jgi:thiol:disulfide interchange protein DsbD
MRLFPSIAAISLAVVNLALSTNTAFSQSVPVKSKKQTSEPVPARLVFAPIKSVADLDAAIAKSKRSGKIVVLNIRANWAIGSQTMANETFSDPLVRKALADVMLLQADVTENDADDQALLKRFGIFGPPCIMFIGPDGVERKKFRVLGYMNPDKFHMHVQSALAS